MFEVSPEKLTYIIINILKRRRILYFVGKLFEIRVPCGFQISVTNFAF